MPEPLLDTIRFAYRGGLADSGRLNFYELGRAYYAASRLVYTVARFRRSGKVLAEISERIETQIVAEKTPQRGSFVFDAVALLLPAVAQAAVDVPLTVIFAWIWDRILPTSKLERAVESDALVEMARIGARSAIKLSKQENQNG